MDLDRRLAEAREHDTATWAVLLEHGMQDGAPLTIDSFFHADDEARARSLAAVLTDAGAPATVEASQERAGLFRKKTVWSVQWTASLWAASLEDVIEHSATMLRLADAEGVEYDGWGAQVPSSE
ncbi:ribonuclease E inhibitor RraB [Actinotalea solisilvae]|uniref:ribonuclease E inhibitor RraB n=1 Tax=Actinotalea solisilvae TaxID=2072922 RepID=UPI0018F11942|nr:ribonuclease E inhibitor RraB [Actinotalea solisilvae]